MNKRLDVTELVTFSSPDDDCLPITKCVCGTEFPIWQFTISIYDDNDAYQCPECKRKLWFSSSIHVYEIVEN